MKKIFAAIIFIAMPLMAGAQALKGSYFLDSSLNRHEFNPAFAPRANYFQMLGIGNLGVGAMTNLDVPTFFYPKNGELLTFLHQDVSVAEFDKALAKHPHLDMDVHTNLFGFGFYTKNLSYWTFDVDFRTLVDVDLPRDLFMFMKKGTGTVGQSYNIGNMNAYMTAAVQASLGYSRDIIKGLRAGIKARFIAPIAYAGLNLENVRLDTAKDKWTLTTEGYADVALSGLEISGLEDSLNNPGAGNNMSIAFDLNRLLSNGALAGMGVSFDLGVEWTLKLGTLFDGLSVSAAVTDLGVISYKPEVTTSYKSAGSVDWRGFQNVSMDNMEFEESINEFVENAKASLLNMSETNTEAGFKRSTMPRFYLGAEMPFLKNTMSLGLLYSSRLSHSYARHELTLSYNLNPCKWFALGVNYSFLNTVNTMGFILELTPKWGPTFYLGADYLPVTWSKAPILMGENSAFNMLPLSMRLNLNFGIAFHLGSKHLKPKEVKKYEFE